MDRLKLLKERHSVRNYTGNPLSSEIVNKLKAEITFINTHVAGLKFQLFFNDSNPFKGFFKSYGTFVNPSNYMAAVVDTSVDNISEKAGYYAEQFVIKAVEEGLGTCFVGDTYDSSSVNARIRVGEKILFVVLFGEPLKKERTVEKLFVKFVHRKKMNSENFFEPEKEYQKALSLFPNLTAGLEAVACAPSSLNKRPVRVFMKKIDGYGQLCARVDDRNPKNLIDLGIAKFNYNYATETLSEWGNGAPLEIPEE